MAMNKLRKTKLMMTMNDTKYTMAIRGLPQLMGTGES
jgi:hypothetical protein